MLNSDLLHPKSWTNLDKLFGATKAMEVWNAFKGIPAAVVISLHDVLFRFGTSSDFMKSPLPPWYGFLSGAKKDAKDDFDRRLERARTNGESIKDLARARLAVLHEWSSMDHFITVQHREKDGIVGYYGLTRHQPFDSKQPSPKGHHEWQQDVYFMGGEWQLWIPRLQRHQIQKWSPDPI